MPDPRPRMAGAPLRFLSWLLRAPLVGAPLRRVLGAQVVDAPLAAVDFAAEGEPAPFYMPQPYRPATVKAATPPSFPPSPPSEDAS